MDAVLCPACLARSDAAQGHCASCRAPLVLGGRFVVLEPLAAKGSARTLGGREREGGRPVVIKALSVSGLTDWKQLELFQRGIGVLRGLSHPGIPQHLGDGQFARGGETFYYWVQQRVPGRTLEAGLADGQRWTEARARALCERVLEILEYLQGFSPPILHRDIKPSNVMELPGDEGFALIDFDLVKDTLDPDGGETTALGTAGYAPLEQLMGRAVPASDLYGLGATLVALLSRKSPADLLEEDDNRLDFRAHVRVSEAFAGFLEQLLDPRVSQRPADAAAARALLRGLQEPAETRESEATQALVAGTGAEDEPRDPGPVVVPSATTAEPVVAAKPSSEAVVSVQGELAALHPAPWWVLPVRLSILIGSLVVLPARGVVLVVLVVAIGAVSGLLVRFPVRLPPGRALYMGGLSNTGTPGTYWLRRRWRDKVFSIPLSPLHLDWRPAPTRLTQGPLHCWLELELELWVEPCADDMRQFFALLNYDLWQRHPQQAAVKLRDDVLKAVVEHVREAGLVARGASAPLRLDGAQVVLALEEGLRRVGLEVRHVAKQRITLRPHTDDLSSEDRLWIDPRPPPAALSR